MVRYMLQGARRYTNKSITVPTGATLNMCIVLLWSQLEATAYLLPAWYEYMSEAHLVLAGKGYAAYSMHTVTGKESGMLTFAVSF
jgi:hypothetical protein